MRSRVADETATIGGHEPWGALLALTGAIALLAGGGAALFAALAGGSIGPGRLAVTGPDPGAVALAVAIEVAVGSGILLLAPRGARDDADRPAPVTLGGSPSAWFDVDGTGRPDPSSTGAGGRDEGSEAPR
ncbi:MAG TPA: hypothetical protein DCP95_13290 [Microbacterium ginsengisoli]|uniref:Uncharacterized protein n=1 Tax=Microbacterium ginsengisoli TaxID=400772 RepID=A0A3C1KGE0_9MICO|nr:hypothetical protein [Microbacterium ginsengisoli]